MGNTANSTLAGVDCCTAIDSVGDEEAEMDGLSSQGGSQGGNSLRLRKPDRGLCHQLTGESLFTECIDDRCSQDRRGRHGIPPNYASGAAAHMNGDGSREPAWSRNTLSQSLSTPPSQIVGGAGRVNSSVIRPNAMTVLEEKMRKLVTLHQRGHISDGEFFVAKARLLQGKDLTLNPVASPGAMREEFLDSLSDTTPRSSVQYTVTNDSDNSSLWGTGKGERFAEDLVPDDPVPIHRSQARAARATFIANSPPAGGLARGGDASVQDFIPLKYVPHQGDSDITIVTDVPVPHAPTSEWRSPLPPPATRFSPQEGRPESTERISARVIFPTRLGTVAPSGLSPGNRVADKTDGLDSHGKADYIRQTWLAERENALRAVEANLSSGTGAGKSEKEERQAKATAAILAEANRQVEEQKRLLQREQMKLLKVLNGPGGVIVSPAASNKIVSPGSEGESRRSSKREDGSVEERMRRFLSEEPQVLKTVSVVSPRALGRVINLSPHNDASSLTPLATQNRETQFVI